MLAMYASEKYLSFGVRVTAKRVLTLSSQRARARAGVARVVWLEWVRSVQSWALRVE